MTSDHKATLSFHTSSLEKVNTPSIDRIKIEAEIIKKEDLILKINGLLIKKLIIGRKEMDRPARGRYNLCSNMTSSIGVTVDVGARNRKKHNIPKANIGFFFKLQTPVTKIPSKAKKEKAGFKESSKV